MDDPFQLEMMMSLVIGAALILVILLPMLPALVIYKLFPDTKVGVNGGLGDLKLNATGAFASYIVVLAFIVLSPLYSLIDIFGGFYKPTWTIEATVKSVDLNGKPVQIENIDILLNPELHRISSDKIKLRIPGIKQDEWPVVVFSTSSGSSEINLATLKQDEFEADPFNKKIELLDPIIIREYPGARNEYAAQVSKYLNMPDLVRD